MLTRNSRFIVGQGREEIHPLFNSAILRNILGFLDVKSLKSVRATCTFWKEESNSILQNKSQVRITWYNREDRKKIPTLPTFMKYVESVTPENVFFRNYELHEWCLHSKETEMTQFWLQCGHHIRDLVLEAVYSGFYSFYEETYVRNVFYNWTPNMESLRLNLVRFVNSPNYKPLSVKKGTERVSYEDENVEHNSEEKTESDESSDTVPMKKFEILEDIQPNYNFRTFHIDPSYDYPVFPLRWKELFMAYPNLETLSVTPLIQTEDIDNIKELLTDLIEFQQLNPNKLQNLKTLDIFSRFDADGDCAVTDEHFKEAMKLNFKLESLDIHFDETEHLSYSTIGKYIGKLRSTVKTLEIKSGRGGLAVFPPPGNRIIFTNLVSLRIELNALSSNNVKFLQNIPKLEKLFIGDSDSPPGIYLTEPQLFFNTITMKPKNTLHTLEIDDDILTEDCIRKIGEWFPNLSQFGAILDDNLLWATYKSLYKSVERLEIKGKGITDAGITGIVATNNSNEPKPSSSKSLTEEEGPPIKRRKENDDGADPTILGTSIALMKRLRHLTIRRHISSFEVDELPNFEPVQLTDDAVYNGFICLTKLTYLDLSYCAETITEEAFRDLCSRRNIMTLDTTHFYRGYEIEKIERKLRGVRGHITRIEI